MTKLPIDEDLLGLLQSLPSPKVIGIVGSRRRNGEKDYQKCFELFRRIYNPGDSLVSGGCSKGGDRFAQSFARQLGLTITIHYPNWEAEPKTAGFSRNTNIANDCHVLIAVVAEDRTGGTEDTIKKVLGQKKPVLYC